MYVKVKKTWVLAFGKKSKAYVSLRVNQKWEVVNKPDPPITLWWTLKRKETAIEVWPDDFKKYFVAEGEG